MSSPELKPEKLVIRNERPNGCAQVGQVVVGLFCVSMAIWGFSEGRIFGGILFLIGGASVMLPALARAKAGDDRSPKITLTHAGFKHHPSGYEMPWSKVLNVRGERKVIQINGRDGDTTEAKLFFRTTEEPDMETILDVTFLEMSVEQLVKAIREWSSREYEGDNYIGKLEFRTEDGPAVPRKYRVTTTREDGTDRQVQDVEGTSRDDAAAFAVLAGLTVVSVEELPEE